MARGPLYQDKYRPQFSGHETFPLRYGWLKKAVEANDTAGMSVGLDRLVAAQHKAAESIYRQQAGPGGGAGEPGAAAGGEAGSPHAGDAREGDVIDAEVVDDKK